MIGYPLAIGVLQRKLVSGSMASIDSGHPSIARITFDTPSEPQFTATDAGKFLVVFTTETKRLGLTISVTAPASAAIARNANTWRPLSIDQLMAVDFVWSGSVWNVNTYSVQTRAYMPFQHVSHSFLVDLDAAEECIIDIATAATNLEWTLAVWRLPNLGYSSAVPPAVPSPFMQDFMDFVLTDLIEEFI